jgi:hypothetical protein
MRAMRREGRDPGRDPRHGVQHQPRDGAERDGWT